MSITNEQVAEFLTTVEPRWNDFTQYCIRGLMEHFSIKESKAIRLYHKALDSEIVIRESFTKIDNRDKHDKWGHGFGKIPTGYVRIVWNKKE